MNNNLYSALLPLGLLLTGLVSVAQCDVNMTHGPGHCVYMGTCMDSPYSGQYNTFYNGPPVTLNDSSSELYKLVKETCPHMLNITNPAVCCDTDQVNILKTQTQIAQSLFSRCPACYDNFMQHFCAMTCSPNMSQFMTISDANPLIPGPSGKQCIQAVEIYITSGYADTLFNSCANVLYPEASSKVIDLMCGAVKKCTGPLWLKFLGDPSLNSNLSPFPMTYHIDEPPPDSGMHNFTLANVTFHSCNSTDPQYTCSCSDCPAPNTCPAPPIIDNSTFPYLIVDYAIAAVGISITTIIFLVALISGIIEFIIHLKQGCTPVLKPGPVNVVDERENDEKVPLISTIGTEPLITGFKEYEKQHRFLYSYPHLGHIFENFIKKIFYHWGKFAAKHWYLVLLFAVLISAALCCGLFFFKVTTDPVELWSAPTSRARQEKDYFDQNFSPFYRTEMIIAKLKSNISGFGFEPYGIPNARWNFSGLFRDGPMMELLELQQELTEMKVPYTDHDGKKYNVTLSDICFKPLAPDNTNCTIQSFTNYFQNNITRLMYEELTLFGNVKANSSYHIYYCTKDTTAPEGHYLPFPCLGAYGGPIDPNVVLGGFNGTDYDSATVAIITFVVANHLDSTGSDINGKAEAWEKRFLEIMKNLTENGTKYFTMSYSAERSISDELQRESDVKMIAVLISYFAMFAYIVISLGHVQGLATVILLGLFGVLMVLVAVGASLGFYSYVGVVASLIILEVVPFLVLAVGVDNLFIIIHSFEAHVKKHTNAINSSVQPISKSELMGRALADVAPSLILTSFSETAAFLLGGISSMPAVRAFSLYAGTAVLFNFLLQMTVFVSILSLNIGQRVMRGMSAGVSLYDSIFTLVKWYAKFILHWLVRPFVLLFYGCLFTGALCFLIRVQVGLEPQAALLKDSYLMGYFSDLNTYLHTGAPVYFVVKDGFNYSQKSEQDKICSASYCDRDSLVTQIATYAQEPQYTEIAVPASSWLDTYFEWLSPKSMCCGVNNITGERCHNPGNGTCHFCVVDMSVSPRPTPEEFGEHLVWFLHDNPSKQCASGGHAAFNSSVILGPTSREVKTSYFMTYHTALANSTRFITALKIARKLSENLTLTLGVEVFPYSVWYVYYEQYLEIIKDMGINIGASLGAVFVVTFLLLGLNLWAALMVLAAVASIIVHTLGCMYLLDIKANAVSLVNLVMMAGIAVAFVSHIMRSFVSCPQPSRRKRAIYTLSEMGAFVFSGVTVTKFLGIFVLLFAHPQIFEIYYFRMYMCMLIWGALHGLVYFPVFLSYIGPPSRVDHSPHLDSHMLGSDSKYCSHPMIPVVENQAPSTTQSSLTRHQPVVEPSVKKHPPPVQPWQHPDSDSYQAAGVNGLM